MKKFLIVLLFPLLYPIPILPQEKSIYSIDYTKTIAVADKEYGWGSFQFPTIYRNRDGIIAITWSMGKDDVKFYNKNKSNSVFSVDNGKNWIKKTPENLFPFGGVFTNNGDYIKLHTPSSLNIADFKLKSIGVKKGSYSSTEKYSLYNYNALPDDLKGIYFNRIKKGEDKLQITKSQIHQDSNFLRYSVGNYFPIVWWGNIIKQDIKMLASSYPYFSIDKQGNILPSGIGIYESYDDGYNWELKGVIDYKLKSDAEKKNAFGYTEPFLIENKNGDLICVMRTTDGEGDKPIYLSISKDGGKTWREPNPITNSGVFPQLLYLKNGTMVMSTGRPGIQISISRDGGYTWTSPIEIQDKGKNTCGYTSMIEVNSNSFFLVYSDFDFPVQKNIKRKSIKISKITIYK